MGRLQSGKVCRAAFEWRLAYCFDKCSPEENMWSGVSLPSLRGEKRRCIKQARSWDGDEENLCFSWLVSAHKSTLISKPVCWRPHHHTADHQGSLTVNVSSWTHICTSNAPQNRRNAGNPFFSPLISSVLLLPSKSAGFVTADWNIWLYLRKGPEINVFILCCFLFDD